jgi:Xaa-Pro aminopeptidase
MAAHEERLKKACRLMEEAGIDVLLLSKPANMFYLTGDGRLCAFAMITRDGQVGLGVPMTDVADVRRAARFDHIVGFEDEVGMIHSIAHYFEQFGIGQGVMGLEYTFLTQSMMGMFTHPHAKPGKVTVADCTPIMSALRTVKDDDEIERIRAAARVAVGHEAAAEAVKPGLTESQWQPRPSTPCDSGAEFWTPTSHQGHTNMSRPPVRVVKGDQR